MNKKHIGVAGLLLTTLISFSGCSQIGSKSANMSAIYIATTALAFLLLLGYCFLIRKKERWFLVLFSAVTVVNAGYLSLSLSVTLDEALLANRIAYLGSVFLPVSLLMAILNTCKIKLNKWCVAAILGVSVVVFLIAASPGYLDIYYKEVSMVTVNGVSILQKVYGPLHPVYLYYLMLHFSAMIGVVIYAKISKRIRSSAHAVALLASVLVNIGVWLMEQLVDIDFEFLSVSYIVSELFLLTISLLMQDSSIIASLAIKPEANGDKTLYAEIKTNNSAVKSRDDILQQYEYLSSKLYTLTPTEKAIYTLYLEGNRTKEVTAKLNITENTLKYHNKNIYSKLGVANRKELIEVTNTPTINA